MILRRLRFWIGVPILAAGLTGCAELQVLRERVAVQDAEIAKLRKDNAEFQKAYYQINGDRSAEMTALQERVDQLTRELDQARSFKTDREKKLEDEMRKLSLDADASRDDLGTRLARATTSMNQLGENLSKTESERQELRKRLAELDKLHAQAEQSIKKLETDLAAEKAKLASAEQSNTELQGKLKAEQSARRSAEGKSADLAKQLANAQKDFERVQSEAESLRADRKTEEAAAGKLAAAEEETRKLKEQVTALKSRPAMPSAEEDAGLQAAAKELGTAVGQAEGGKPIQTKLDKRGLRIIIPSDIAFSPETVILADSIKPVLKSVAASLKNLPGRTIRIEGHTDDQPINDLPFSDNWGLGAARADRIRQYLIEEGRVEPERLEVVSRAHADAVADNKSPEGRAKNRRVEIVVGTAK